MDILYSHLSTLFHLWRSLEVDPCTINTKLYNVIQELECLIKLEKKEKLYLAADIEDLASSIEDASIQLGISAEDTLQVDVTIPTVPKHRLLLELNNKLNNEIITRQCHLKKWLPEIEQLSKELDLHLKEYDDSDLSWANVQMISCDLRDLRELKAQRSKEFELLVRAIQYYWNILDHTVNTSDALEVSLDALFQHFPLPPDTVATVAPMTMIVQDTEYFHKSLMKLSQNNLNQLRTMKQNLETIFKSRLIIYTKSITKIKTVWEELQVPILERPILPTKLGTSDMVKLKDIVNNLDPFIKRAFEKYILQFKGQLESLWDSCLVSRLERDEFIASLYKKNTKQEIKFTVDKHIRYLRSMVPKGQALLVLMKERKDLIQKMIDFEKKASDPKRLFQASFQLLEEEKWRNTCLPRLLQLDRSLIKAIQEFEKLAGKPVMFGGKRYLDTLLEEIADREANQTFFGFLNTEPSTSTTTITTNIKRIKNARPASVGSLGSMVKKQQQQQQQPQKPHVMCPTSSQSMPLDKLPKRQQVSKDSKPSSSIHPISHIPSSPKAYKKNNGHVSGMKALLLDTETTPIISLVTTQSALLTKECYLIDRIDNRNRDRLKHLKCICFLRPTRESLHYLIAELREPAYGDYYLYFSNTIRKADIEQLAEVDEHEVIREVQEYFGDYLAINPDLFSLGQDPHQLFGNSVTSWQPDVLNQTVAQLSAVLLSLKKRPLIRYQGASEMAKTLAEELQRTIQQEGQLFDFRRPDTPPIMLILDRRNDPVTPLLTQWTYQAMVHELIGIHHGRVDMSNVPEVKNELKEIVLSPDQDPFFKKSMYFNLGDLGATIKQYVDEYQAKTKSNMNIETIADMKRFVEEYPEFRKLSSNVSKHVALVSELSRRVSQDHLLEVSEAEQSIACNGNHGSDLDSVQKLLSDPRVPEEAKVRLALLYVLRYETTGANRITAMADLLDNVGVSDRKSALIPALLHYAGEKRRQGDLFSNQSLLSRGKSALKGLKGVENVYTQHTPFLADILDSLIKARLKENEYPFIQGNLQVARERPQDIIVFICGGATYEEARYIAQLNDSAPGVRIVLGGNCIHNSKSFLEQVEQANRFIY
ncbi:hypothetical protein G6F68_003952 [Rhizopus microsporus]|nr:hypothetical protein G6F68_003952 [Rhizopus microsporus]